MPCTPAGHYTPPGKIRKRLARLLFGVYTAQMKTSSDKGNGLKMNVSSILNWWFNKGIFKITYYSDLPVNKALLNEYSTLGKECKGIDLIFEVSNSS